MNSKTSIYILGNPNVGKSSLFNTLTGLDQKIGNFPGVTVEKKRGNVKAKNKKEYSIIDLPGIYSLYPRKEDEHICYKEILSIAEDKDKKKNSIVLCCVDATNLRRNLLLFSQLKDMNLPIIVGITMVDIAQKKGIQIDEDKLSKQLECPVIKINPNSKKSLKPLFQTLDNLPMLHHQSSQGFFAHHDYFDADSLSTFYNFSNQESTYCQFHSYICKHDKGLAKKNKMIGDEILLRYTSIDKILKKAVSTQSSKHKFSTKKLDDFLLHPFWGYATLGFAMFIFFQMVFLLADYPMGWIDSLFAYIIDFSLENLPNNMFSNFLANGVLGGLNAVLVFVPQIMILFGMINLLEDSGYMARISVLADKFMNRFGLSGKSVVPMIGGMACAVPSIMATKSIENKKERLLSVLITPLISCSARLPVYVLLISITIPNTLLWGFVSFQGLVLTGLYLFSYLSAFLVSLVLNKCMKAKEKNIFFMELPNFIVPRWKNVGMTMIQKTKIFVFNAGKMILLMSMVIWFLSNFGPPSTMKNIKEKYKVSSNASIEDPSTYEQEKLEHSFAGIIGKSIEPVIEPLGFDWKIGITLITSFVAREVFVSTIYILFQGEKDNEGPLERIKNARREDGTKVFTKATSFSLIIFFSFALQCMSTLAIVRRELGSWKYPVLQFTGFLVLAYLFSLLTYQVLS